MLAGLGGDPTLEEVCPKHDIAGGHAHGRARKRGSETRQPQGTRLQHRDHSVRAAFSVSDPLRDSVAKGDLRFAGVGYAFGNLE